MGKQKESEIIAHYLLGVLPSTRSIELYEEGVKEKGMPLSTHEARLWDRTLRWPFLLPYVDGGLALTNRMSPIRMRLHLMCAILETEPALSGHFIYEGGTWWFFRSAFYVIRSIVRAVVGLAVIRILR